MKYTTLLLLLFVCHNLLWGQANFDQNPSVKIATAFLKTLSPTQKAAANLSFRDTSRTKWNNLPMGQVTRQGIQIKDLADSQKVILHSLLRTVLSQQGYQKFLFIIQYDEATHERLGKSNSPIADRYGNQNYWFTIFGTPQAGNIWAWKFEGHHISLNFTYSPKGVTCTPMFVGVNPALTIAGPYSGNYIMFEENDWGNQLFDDLSTNMKQKAIVSSHPKDADVMTQVGKEAHLKDQKGVPYSKMTPKQKILVEKIAGTWIENLTPALAQEKMALFRANKNKVIFTWQGSLNSGDLHYYSIKTNTFIIEFTNRDGGIYHYHTLWRDLTEDFQGKRR